MRKHTFGILAVLAVMLMVFIGTATAATFNAPRGSMVTAYVTGDTAVVSWTGMEVAEVQQYRYDNSDGKGFILAYKPSGNSVSFPVYTGDRFQLVDKSGRFLFLSPELAVANYPSISFKGVDIECSHPKGCALQVAR